MKSLIQAIAFALFAQTAHADLTIFDVRKTLSLADSDPVFRDFYINGGSESGLSSGMVITVTRRLPLYDTYQNRSAGDLDLKVAKVKIIHVQRGLAVARLHSEFTRENAPLLEDPFIMVGDRLDLSTATHDSKGDGKGKNAEQESPQQSEPVASSAKPTGTLFVNSVEMSSEAPKPSPTPPTPQNVDMPILQ